MDFTQIEHLIELKGRFYVLIGIRKNRPLVTPYFKISLSKEDLSVLKELQSEIGGEIKKRKTTIYLEIRRILDCKKVLSFLSNPFLPSVKNKVEKWRRVVEMVDKGDHLTKNGFLEICEIVEEMEREKIREKFEKMIDEGKIKFDEEKVKIWKKISKSKRLMSEFQTKFT